MKKTYLQEQQGKILIYTHILVLVINFGVIFVYGLSIKISEKKFGPEGLVEDYGYDCKLNDIVGVLLEFK